MTQYSLGPAYGGMTAEQAVAEEKKANVIPAGEYVMTLSACDLSRKQRKNAADGVLDTLFKLTLTIQEGEFTGRTIFKYIGVDHGNPQYMRSSMAFVGSLAIALGEKGVVTSLDPFLHKPFIGKVSVSKDRGDGYGPSNDVRSCKPANGYSAAPSAQYTPSAVTAPPAPQIHHEAPPPPPSAGLTPGATPPWKTAG